MPATKSRTEITIQNIVVSTSLEHDIPLIKLAEVLPNTEYNPEQFPGLVMRIKDPKTSALIFSSGKIVLTGAKSLTKVKESLQKIIKNLAKIKIRIKREFPSKLVVNIVERKPQMVFCSTENCFMLDENGEAYDNYFLSEENDKNDFIILLDESSKKINLGEIVLEKKYMEYVQGIKGELSARLEMEVENNFRVVSLISKDIRVKTKEGPEIYFNENINLEKEIEMLKVVLENKIEKNQRQDLEYVDLRIDNKIYYKFRDGTPSQIAKDAVTANSTTQTTAPTSLTENKDKKKKD